MRQMVAVRRDNTSAVDGSAKRKRKMIKMVIKTKSTEET